VWLGARYFNLSRNLQQYARGVTGLQYIIVLYDRCGNATGSHFISCVSVSVFFLIITERFVEGLISVGALNIVVSTLKKYISYPSMVVNLLKVLLAIAEQSGIILVRSVLLIWTDGNSEAVCTAGGFDIAINILSMTRENTLCCSTSLALIAVLAKFGMITNNCFL